MPNRVSADAVPQLWVHDGERMVLASVSVAPGLYKIFDEILVNAADNKARDPRMDTLRVDIDPARQPCCLATPWTRRRTAVELGRLMWPPTDGSTAPQVVPKTLDLRRVRLVSGHQKRAVMCVALLVMALKPGYKPSAPEPPCAGGESDHGVQQR